MENIVVCAHCGAKLRLKPGARKVMKEVRCAKCRKPIALSDESDSPAPAPVPVAGQAVSTPAVSESPTLKPASPPSAPAPAPAPPSLAAEGTTQPPPAAPVDARSTGGAASAGDLETRVAKIEVLVADLARRLERLTRTEAELARSRTAAIEPLAQEK